MCSMLLFVVRCAKRLVCNCSAQFVCTGSARVESLPDKVISTEGKTVTLTCRASGKPKPTIVWARSGRKDFCQVPRCRQDNSSLDTLVNSTLTISDILPGDSGMYSCTAINELNGTPQTDLRFTNVTVYCKANNNLLNVFMFIFQPS